MIFVKDIAGFGIDDNTGIFPEVFDGLPDLAGVSLPTIQRMEASDGNVRGILDTLTKVVDALA